MSTISLASASVRQSARRERNDGKDREVREGRAMAEPAKAATAREKRMLVVVTGLDGVDDRDGADTGGHPKTARRRGAYLYASSSLTHSHPRLLSLALRCWKLGVRKRCQIWWC